MHKRRRSLEYIKVKWSSGKEINLLLSGALPALAARALDLGSWEGKLVLAKVYITCKTPNKGRFPPGSGFER